MKRQSLFRTTMIVAGILATVVIVLSQALPEISKKSTEKDKTEQTEAKSEQISIIPTPSDGVPGASTQVEAADRVLLETLESPETEIEAVQCATNVLSNYLQVLFRAIISPNAP